LIYQTGPVVSKTVTEKEGWCENVVTYNAFDEKRVTLLYGGKSHSTKYATLIQCLDVESTQRVMNWFTTTKADTVMMCKNFGKKKACEYTVLTRPDGRHKRGYCFKCSRKLELTRDEVQKTLDVILSSNEMSSLPAENELIALGDWICRQSGSVVYDKTVIEESKWGGECQVTYNAFNERVTRLYGGKPNGIYTKYAALIQYLDVESTQRVMNWFSRTEADTTYHYRKCKNFGKRKGCRYTITKKSENLCDACPYR